MIIIDRNGQLRLARMLAVGTAMLLAAVATRKGPGLSVDSVSYLSTGINIAGWDGLVALADQPATIFPPGLATVAALGETIGIGAETTLRIVSILSFGAIVALGGHLLRRVVPNRGVEVGATALLAVSPVLLGVSKMAWSEPPFLVVTLVFLLVLGGIWERRRLDNVDVARLVGLCWIGFLLRYAGTAMIAAGGIALLLAIRPFDRRAFARVAAFGVLSASVPIAWMLRNHAADGTYLGNRSPSQDSIREVASRTVSTFGEWLVPISGPTTRLLAVVGMLGALLTFAGLVMVLRPRRDAAVTVAARGNLLACATFAIVYVGFLTLASLSSSFEPTNSRYLSPVYVPAVAIGSAALAALLARQAARRWSWAIGAVVALLFVGQVSTSAREVRDGFTEGIGYNTDASTGSDIAAVAARVVATSAPSNVFSNDPNALWAATRMQPIRWAPRDVGFRGAPLEGELDAFAEHVRCSPTTTYLVYYLLGRARVVSLDEIRAVVDVDRVEGAADGTLFRVSPRDDAPCPDLDLRPTRRR